MPKFADGVITFQKDVFPEMRDFFETLAKGQSPEVLFITCSDSRVEPKLLTQSEPGDLFVLRNAGNIVPPHTGDTGGMTATIEYGMSVLNIPHIVVCGHTDCGAMKGALMPDSTESLPHVRRWLGYADAAREVVKEIGEDLPKTEKENLLIERNVVLQLNHLRTHPSVLRRLATKSLTLHGWVYDIKDGRVRAYSDASDTFEPVEDFYADVAKSVIGDTTC